MYIKDFRQPLIKDDRGLFFKPNKVVLQLLMNLVDSYRESLDLETVKNITFEKSVSKLVKVVMEDRDFSKEDRMHFLQLLGSEVERYEEMCKKIDAND